MATIRAGIKNCGNNHKPGQPKSHQTWIQISESLRFRC